MNGKAVAIACDHAGYVLKEEIKEYLNAKGYSVVDLGTDGPDSVDYPDFGYAMGTAIEDGTAAQGILICGSGIGISIAANRNPAVRAALCQSGLAARLSREHNNANVLALGARLIGVETALDCVDLFLNTQFVGGERHERRLGKLGK